MAVIDIKWNPTSKELRQFAGLQLIFFALVAAWLHHRVGSSVGAVAVLSVSILACVLGLLWPRCLRWVFVGWILAVFPIGWLVSHTLLAILFYLVFTPVGIIMRLCGYDPMHRRWDRDADSYWKPRTPPDDTQRYFKQY